MMHEAIIFIHLLPLSNLIIISRFRRIIIVTCFLLPIVLCLLISGPFKAIIIAKWAQKAQDNPTVTKSVNALEVMAGRTSGLGTTFLKCRVIKSAGLKEFSCTSLFEKYILI
jgi:hypothetical protein